MIVWHPAVLSDLTGFNVAWLEARFSCVRIIKQRRTGSGGQERWHQGNRMDAICPCLATLK